MGCSAICGLGIRNDLSQRKQSSCYPFDQRFVKRFTAAANLAKRSNLRLSGGPTITSEQDVGSVMLKAVLNEGGDELIDGAKDEPVLPGRAAIGISARTRHQVTSRSQELFAANEQFRCGGFATTRADDRSRGKQPAWCKA